MTRNEHQRFVRAMQRRVREAKANHRALTIAAHEWALIGATTFNLLPPPDEYAAIYPTVERMRAQLNDAMRLQQEITIQWHALAWMLLIIHAIEYAHYTDEDSPKGENIPGVRYEDEERDVRTQHGWR